MTIDLRHPIHESCSHKTGYLCDLPETDGHQGGWTWHRTLKGAMRQRDGLVSDGYPSRATIYRILCDDLTEEVFCG